MKVYSIIQHRAIALAPVACLVVGIFAGTCEAASLQLVRSSVSNVTGGVVLVQVPPASKSVPVHQGSESYGASKLPRPKSGAERPFQHNGVTTGGSKSVDKPQLKGNERPFQHNGVTTTYNKGVDKQKGVERPFQHNGVTTSYNKGVGKPKGGTKLPFDHNTMTSGAGNKTP